MGTCIVFCCFDRLRIYERRAAERFSYTVKRSIIDVPGSVQHDAIGVADRSMTVVGMRIFKGQPLVS